MVLCASPPQRRLVDGSASREALAAPLEIKVEAVAPTVVSSSPSQIGDRQQESSTTVTVPFARPYAVPSIQAANCSQVAARG